MRSAELARLAGVTVRALRHYHQVGVLAEPPRGANGYRGYDVHDLVRVLRIRRLAALGIQLERMPELLDDSGHSSGDGAGSLLDELERELGEQIDRLTRQRELVAHLREHGAAPDLPPELAPYVAVFAASGFPPELARFDRDQSVLLAHLAGEQGLPYLTSVYERLSDPALVPAMTDVAERFGRLGADSTDEDVAALVEGFAEIFGPVVGDLVEPDPPIDLGATEDIVGDHTSDVLNARQRQVLEQLGTRLAPPLAPE